MKLLRALVYSLYLLPAAVLAFGPSVHPDEAKHIVNSAVTLPKSGLYKNTKKTNNNNEVVVMNTPNKVQLKEVSTLRKKWGVDNDHPNEYWFDDRIHTLGNHGFWGAVHAAAAPLSTKIIDVAAYNGRDVRKMVR